MAEYRYIFQMFGFLIIIALGSYLALRYGLRAVYPGLSKGYLKVLERVPLDHKNGSALVLVKVGGEVLLVGVAQGRISLLKKVDLDNLPAAAERESGGCLPLQGSFARIFQGLRGNSPPGSDREGGEK
ncbi:MAG: flagellar biosynthetic protein FliO [Bacillota bacterium]